LNPEILEKRFSIEDLAAFSEKVFAVHGFSEEDARLSASLLVRADLRGIDSHGIARLSGYVRLIQAGRLNPRPKLRFESKFPTQGLLHADQAIGFISGSRAMEKCIEMAELYGCGMVAVRNSNHFGIAGQYALMAAEKGLAAFAFTNASPLVAPSNSTSRMLGTNPIAAAFPAMHSRPFVLDMATTTAANGKLEILQRKKEEAPAGWIQNASGKSSTNPDELKKGGALMPLGGETKTGGHKGYGLGSLVDILSGVLSGANFGPWVPPFVSFLPLPQNPVGEGIGHFFIVFRPDGFLEASEYQNRMENWMTAMRNSAKSGGEDVLVAGDPEWQAEEERKRNGVPLHEEVIRDLRLLAEESGIKHSFLS
jgi:LDH2 family malate/lactate/ureidoglycolate dehydrogenase